MTMTIAARRGPGDGPCELCRALDGLGSRSSPHQLLRAERASRARHRKPPGWVAFRCRHCDARLLRFGGAGALDGWWVAGAAGRMRREDGARMP